MKKLAMIILAGIIVTGCSGVAEVAPNIPECLEGTTEDDMGDGGGDGGGNGVGGTSLP